MNTIDHEKAVQGHAAERYLLDELSQEERNDFEEHYFTCTDCATEVRAVFAFADNAKAVFSDESARPAAGPVQVKTSSIAAWFASLRPVFMPLAAAILLCVTLYQSLLVIPGLNRELGEANVAHVLPTVVARAATRGDDAVVVVGEKEPFVNLVLDINTTASVSSYRCEVRDDSGALRFDIAALPPQAGTLSLLLPASGLQSGHYSVTVRPAGSASQSATEPEKYTFLLQRK